ncbi:MAG TPA: hypothetical protein VMN56_20255 [Casimicrobiaceae bacterium]|nr:hypothetical protein [Casimicrobiaceae bacterium]
MSTAAFSDAVRTTRALTSSRDSVVSDVLPSLTPTRTPARSTSACVLIAEPAGMRQPCSTCSKVGEKSRSCIRMGVALVNIMSTSPAFAAAKTSAFIGNTTGSNGTPARAASARPRS